jgi:acetyl-CoA C-acetyltransferase
MAGILRAAPGTYGLCTGNGWYLTKQAIGIYSTRPFEGRWERQDPHVIQRRIDALPHPEITETPEGPATVETYTVVHTRDGYRMGIVVGRDEAGRRFVANTSNDPAFLSAFESAEQVGRRGTVRRHDDGRRNLFTPS